jgi:hypothetical protein
MVLLSLQFEELRALHHPVRKLLDALVRPQVIPFAVASAWAQKPQAAQVDSDQRDAVGL